MWLIVVWTTFKAIPRNEHLLTCSSLDRPSFAFVGSNGLPWSRMGTNVWKSGLWTVPPLTRKSFSHRESLVGQLNVRLRLSNVRCTVDAHIESIANREVEKRWCGKKKMRVGDWREMFKLFNYLATTWKLNLTKLYWSRNSSGVLLKI